MILLLNWMHERRASVDLFTVSVSFLVLSCWLNWAHWAAAEAHRGLEARLWVHQVTALTWALSREKVKDQKDIYEMVKNKLIKKKKNTNFLF